LTVATLLDLLMGTKGGWAPDVQQSGVRPDYGLSTVTGIGQTAKSPYERTLRPGEQRSSEELRDMLAEVILAAGAGAVPGVGPKGQARRAPERIRPGYEKQFSEWFRGSKVVNEKGEPLTLYHGTVADEPFTAFRTKGGGSPIIQDRLGAHFGTVGAAAKRLEQAPANAEAGAGPRMMPVHLSIKNPMTKANGTPFSESEMRGVFNKIAKQLGIDPAKRPRDASSAVKAHLMAQGFDGIAYRNSIEDRGSTSYIVFSPSQIKSATGNRGTYDPRSEDIRE
jgi:hypothetical protein